MDDTFPFEDGDMLGVQGEFGFDEEDSVGRTLSQSLFAKCIKPRLEAGNTDLFLHIACGNGETVGDIWKLSNGQTLCVGINTSLQGFEFDCDTVPFEVVSATSSGYMDYGRCRMCVEQIPLQQQSRFAMRPWLFEGDFTHTSVGPLLQAATVVLVTTPSCNDMLRKQILRLCSTFCEAGTLVLTSQVCVDAAICDTFTSFPSCWNRIGSVIFDVYGSIFDDDVLHVHELQSSLESRVWDCIKSEVGNVSLISVKETVRCCLGMLGAGRKSIKRREIRGAANKAKSCVMKILERWNILIADVSRRERAT